LHTPVAEQSAGVGELTPASSGAGSPVKPVDLPAQLLNYAAWISQLQHMLITPQQQLAVAALLQQNRPEHVRPVPANLPIQQQQLAVADGKPSKVQRVSKRK
jgi:hypothetical protein